MPRRTRAELEVENAELRERLSTVYEELAELFDDDEPEDQDDEEADEEP